MAQAGNMAAVKVMAKDLVRTRKHIHSYFHSRISNGIIRVSLQCGCNLFRFFRTATVLNTTQPLFRFNKHWLRGNEIEIAATPCDLSFLNHGWHRFLDMKAQLTAVKLKVQTMKSQEAMNRAMTGVTKVLSFCVLCGVAIIGYRDSLSIKPSWKLIRS